jgi:outer membrane receptor protein involved in Fe transport
MTARTLIRRISALAALVALTLAAAAQTTTTTTKNFNVPADLAAAALKAFSAQSGAEVLVPTDAVQGIRTNAVTGSLTPRAALEKMTAGTGLVVVQDEKTGALGLRPDAAKNGASRPEKLPAAKIEKSETGAIKLETVSVLGTRIRQTETEGPSPVSSFDKEYIRATGAMTLSDFLNQIPQTYSGVSSGRSSAPNELNPEFGQRTETTNPAFNLVLGSSAAPPGQTGVSGVSLRGLGSGSTLVLVDGRRAAQSGNGNRSTDTRQGFVDLNTIPLGMIERIEVSTDGASAIYGADAVAGVINIILKKHYSGAELSGGYKASEHGGGRERSASLIAGFTRGKLDGTIAVEYYDRQNLKASDRRFSKNQNHTGIPTGVLTSTGAIRYGVDWRLNWGYPAVIQASGGVVSGTFDAIPGVRVVAVPVGSATTPTLAQFVPITTPAGVATVVNASAQRRANTAAFLDLIPESTRKGLSGNLNYKFNDLVSAFGTFRTSDTRSLFEAQPGANSITGGFGSAVSLPAAFNPFNQNVTIGMILPEWGSQSQRVRTLDDAGTLGLHGKVGQTWEWELGGSYEKQKARQISRNFNPTPFANLLIAADPTKRFNPFIDYTAPGAISQADLLETLSIYPVLASISEQNGLDFAANGDLATWWGGTVKMAFGGSTLRDEVVSTATNVSSVLVPVATATTVMGSQTTKAQFAELLLPVFGKANAMPLLRRLDFNVAARHEDNSRFSKTVPKFGVSWTPVQPLLVRASWSDGFRAPGVTEYLTAPSVVTSTLNDPRRTPIATGGIIETRGSNLDPQPELSKNTFAGIVYEPTFIKGLNLQVNYYDTVQKDVLQLISAQNIINNEALFPDRITRAAATPADLALNQPGQILTVNRVFVNYGQVVNRSMDVVVDYRLPWEHFGRFRVNVAATRTLRSSRQVAPGQPAVILEEDTASPAKWRFNAAVFWNRGNWNASTFVTYLDSFASNSAGNNLVANSASLVFYPTPSVAKFDVRGGYEFRNGVWRGYGKGLRVSLGVNNLFDKEPPFSDTVWGFNAGLHSQYILGRSYELAFILPL